MKGFTLLELIIVMFILMIIGTVSQHAYNKFLEQKNTQTIEIVDPNRPTITRSE